MQFYHHKPWHASIAKFKKLLDKHYDHKQLNSFEADGAKAQYDNCLKSVCISNEDKFLNFDFKRDRVDEFLGSFMNGINIKFSHLWTVYKFVFVLPHGHVNL